MTDCKCVRCGTCNGSGQVSVRTGSYPEWELERCPDGCDGGLSEVCQNCIDEYDREQDEMEASR